LCSNSVNDSVVPKISSLLLWFDICLFP
jgi:hypothetical protein